MKDRVALSEMYKQIQGEGPCIGQSTIFVRFFGCNTVCPWCDTMYAVKKQKDDTIRFISIDQLVQEIKDINCTDITFTGGEPLLQRAVTDVAMGKLGLDYTFHFETNGMIYSEDFPHNVAYMVSPKFHDMKLDELDKKTDDYMNSLHKWAHQSGHEVCFKFVYEGPQTVETIYKIEHQIGGFGKRRIYLMPEGKSFNQEKYRECSQVCLDTGWWMSPRMQTILWGPKRGT